MLLYAIGNKAFILKTSIMKLLISLLLNGLLVFIASALLSGVHIEGFVTAIIVSVLLCMVNSFIKPILTFFTLPITILTLGLFLFVINGAMVLLVDGLLSNFRVDGLLWAIGFSIVVSILNMFIGSDNNIKLA